MKKELENIHRKITESIFKQKDEKEEDAVSKVKKNPKFFYSYAKKSRKARSRVGPLFDENKTLQNDPKVMANLLQQQYSSVFSNTTNPTKVIPEDKKTRF